MRNRGKILMDYIDAAICGKKEEIKVLSEMLENAKRDLYRLEKQKEKRGEYKK